jgi:hypothetical protein
MTTRLASALPVTTVALSGMVLAGCVIVTDETIANREVYRYRRVMSAAKVDFASGDLSRRDVQDQQIMFPPFAGVPGKPVTCRSDVVVDAAGAVQHICTVCTDGIAENARLASDGYARTLRYKPGAAGRRGVVTFAYAPQRPDGTIIVPHIPAPAAGCEPQPVNA